MRFKMLCGVVAVCGLVVGPRIGLAETDMPTPVAQWTFDEAGAEGRDARGTHPGTVHGATPHAGKIGGGLLFDRSRRHYVEVPHAAELELSTFTVSAWVWLTKPPTFSGIVGTRQGGANLFDMNVNTDKVQAGRVLRIGDTGAGEFMDGVIDDVQIYAAALTDAQVVELARR